MSELRMKTVGRRRQRPHANLNEVNGFLELGAALRPIPDLVPRGVYRFRTFAEAQTWMNEQILQTLNQNSRGRRP